MMNEISLASPIDFQAAAELLDGCAPHQKALVRILAVSECRGLDAEQLVSSLAAELPASSSHQMNDLAEQLAAGVDVVDALNKIPSLLPPSVVLAFRLAREDETLPALFWALERSNPESDIDDDASEENYLSRYFRLMARVFVFSLLLMFITLRIVPEFLQMLEEFDVEAPAALRLLTISCDYFARFWFVGPLFLFALTPFLFSTVRKYLRRWNPWIWRQPMNSPSVDRRRSLALIAQTGRPLSSGIPMIMETKPLRKIFRRLGKANARMEDGQNQWEALSAEKLISQRDADALMLSTSGDTQAWLLRWSAKNQQARQSTREVVVLRMILTVVNVALALFVALACIAVFTTLFSIMTSLS